MDWVVHHMTVVEQYFSLDVLFSQTNKLNPAHPLLQAKNNSKQKDQRQMCGSPRGRWEPVKSAARDFLPDYESTPKD